MKRFPLRKGVILAALACACAAARGKDKAPPYDPYKFVLPTDRVIEHYEGAARKNPKDFHTLTLLGQLHIRRARETGSFDGYERADAVIRRALELDRDYLPAQTCRAAILIAQHRFADGRRLAEELHRKHKGGHLLLLVGDASLELGDVDGAESAYRRAEKDDPRLFLDSRRARLAELRGQTKEARERMKQACQGEAFASVTKEGRAWFHFRLGEMAFNAGEADEAARHLNDALALNPRYPLALAWLGKLRAGQGKLDEAIKLYGQAVAQSAEPFMLADLGDLYARAGKDFLARLNHDKLVQAAKKDDVYARELSLFYSDHDRNLAEALALAKKDLAVRKDVYAYDALAWALCKNKHYKEAAEAMAEALRLGTKDASLFYHAGMIHRGLGDKAKARDYLKQALELNPHFSVSQADVARRALKELGE